MARKELMSSRTGWCKEEVYMISHRSVTILLSTLLLFAVNTKADTYRLGIAPVMSQEETSQRYDSLLSYLANKTGHRFELVLSKNFMGYWQSMRKQDVFDFMLDGAHLAAYRVERRNNRFVARVDGVVSYALVARAEDMIIEPDELLTRSIGVLPSPNMSAIAIGKLFNNPSKQPKQVVMNNAEEALNAVRGKGRRGNGAYFLRTTIRRCLNNHDNRANPGDDADGD
jgi:hypothetical protein